MINMVIIDDEAVEREGMIQFIDWKKYEIEIVGDAWNGKEGVELLRRLQPDVVLTDVKMPIMNGIEMIRVAQQFLKDTIFVVLSGYGDYEYTSQAMMLGVKYYILKPCDEEKIAKVLGYVKDELKEREEQKQFEIRQYDEKIEKLLPRAKVQFLKSALTNLYMNEAEFLFYETHFLKKSQQVCLLVFRGETSDKHLATFVIDNIFLELMKIDNVLMKTEVDEDVVYLIDSSYIGRAEMVAHQVVEEYKKIFGRKPLFACSYQDEFRNIYYMYQNVCGRMEASEEKINKMLQQLKIEKLKTIKSLDELLLEYHVILVLLNISGFSKIEMSELIVKLLTILYGRDERYQKCRTIQNTNELYEWVIQLVKDKIAYLPTEAEEKMEKILLLIYEYSAECKLSMQWLAREILYINEDYLGRMFKTNMKQKSPNYICRIRMETAERILLYKNDCSIAELAAATGFQEDGQYFCKVFKKYYGQTLSEYRARLLRRGA